MRKNLAIALIAFSLAMVSSALIVKRVQNFLHPQQGKEEVEESFSPFGLLEKINTAHNTDEIAQEQSQNNGSENSLEISFEDEQTPTPKEKEIVKPIIKLNLTEEEKQAIETYSQNPKVQSFVQEISSVISKEELEQGNYLQIAFKPEVRSIFMKYAQDKEFRDLAAQIMKDKNLLQLANNVIKRNEVKK